MNDFRRCIGDVASREFLDKLHWQQALRSYAMVIRSGFEGMARHFLLLGSIIMMLLSLIQGVRLLVLANSVSKLIWL